MQPKFWLIVKYVSHTTVDEFEDREALNTFISKEISTEDLVSLEVISGFSLVKRVQ